MIPLYRLCEVSVYSLINFLPFLALILYLFRPHFRFPGTVIFLLALLLSFAQVFLAICASFLPGYPENLINIAVTMLYAVLCIFVVKIPACTLFFTLLMLYNMENFVVMASKYIEGKLFPALALQPYRWSLSLVQFFVLLLLMIPLFIFLKRNFLPIINREFSHSDFKYLWLIPATFYLIWYYILYGNNIETPLQVALDSKNIIVLFFVNMGGCLVYYIVSKLIREYTLNSELEEKNHLLAMQALQYDSLQTRITEALQLKHDVRHHVILIQEYLSRKEYEKLQNYLNDYQQSLPEDTPVFFCKNTVVNSLLFYFSSQADTHGIRFKAKVSIPGNLSVSETDLSVLLGNLLENALHACLEVPNASPEIIVRGKTDSMSLCLTVDNTFSGELRQTKNGAYLSTKHKGEGLGLKSVKAITERYGGTLRIRCQDHMFCVSVLLNLSE